MIRLKIRPEYEDLYNIVGDSLPLPLKGETIREYVARSGRKKKISFR